MKQILTLLLTLILSFNAYSQVTGIVTDVNNQPLPFVNIYIEGTYTGTTSNDEGLYELDINQPKTYTIVYKYLGYKTLKKTIKIETFPYVLNISLNEENLTLNEVVIDAKENPANKIIRQTIANRKKILKKINTFNADFYSRGLIRIKNAPEKILGQDVGDLGGGLDSTRSGIIYLSETISKIDIKRPDKLKEKIIASKVSGDDNGFSFNNAGDVDYTFYDNTIEIGNQIISPIADYAFNYYTYKLEGVFYDDKGNLINKIQVTPKRKNDRIFTGAIYIVEDQWALYAVELDVTGEQAQIPAVDIITIKQTFSFSENDQLWALISQSIDFAYSIIGIKGDGRFTAVYSNYNFKPNFTKQSFSKELLAFEEEANKKDSTYWNVIRPVPLTKEEITDYVKKDSIQIVRESKTYLDSVDAKSNKFKLSNILLGYSYQNSYKDKRFSISAPISKIKFNTVQGFNGTLSLNYRKNYDEYRRSLRIGTDFNYSESEDQLRATGSIGYKFNNISRPFLTLSGGVKTEQFNQSLTDLETSNTILTLFMKRNYLKIYEKGFARLDYSQELINGFRFYSSIGYEERKPLFNTTDQVWFQRKDKAYTSNNPLDPTGMETAPFEKHNIVKFSAYGRINFDQKYYSYPGTKSNISNDKFPTVTLGYIKGFSASKTQYNFDHINARITQSFDVSNKGRFSYNIKGGTFFKGINIAFMDYHHFNGNQTHTAQGSYLNVFNNLPYYSMSTNKSYAEFHAEHDFKGYILNKIPLLNKLNFNLILGAHSLSTKENKPYQEFTIGLDNIGWGKFRLFRVDYLRSYQSGFINDMFVVGLRF